MQRTQSLKWNVRSIDSAEVKERIKDFSDWIAHSPRKRTNIANLRAQISEEKGRKANR